MQCSRRDNALPDDGQKERIMVRDEEFEAMMKAASVCTLGAALALVTNSLTHTQVEAASHCKGLQEPACMQSAACKWVPERKGAMNVSPRKGHCRLDVKAAGELARKAQQQK